MLEISGEHSKNITAVLGALVCDGLLTQQNQRRWASYRVAGDSPQMLDSSPIRSRYHRKVIFIPVGAPFAISRTPLITTRNSCHWPSQRA